MRNAQVFFALSFALGLTAACTPGMTTDPGLAPVAVSVEEGGAVVCSDPSARETAPYRSITSSGGWETQVGYGRAEARHVGGGLAVADLSGDGRLDILLPSDGGPQLFIAQADGSYVDEASSRLPHQRPGQGSGAVAADHDGDGDLDLFLAGYNESSVLLENDGNGHFSDISQRLGFSNSPRHSVGGSWGDADHDGDLDLFIPAHAEEDAELRVMMATGQGMACDESVFLLNDGTGTYVDGSAQLSPSFLLACTFVGGFFDLNSDGLQDLYTSNDFGPLMMANQVAWQVEGGFDELDQRSLDLRAYSMGLGVGDLNGDDYPDILVPEWSSVQVLESTEDGSWFNSTLALGLGFDPDESGHHVGWSGEIVDLDNDRELELHATFGWLYQEEDILEFFEQTGTVGSNPTSQRDGVWTRDSEGSFVDVGGAWGLDFPGVSRGVVWADLNDDGWLDLIRQELLAPAEIHFANCGTAGWLRVSLAQPGANPDGIGARITVTIDGVSRFADLRAGGTGFAASGPPEVHFGLGDASVVDLLEVRWPDGRVSEVTDLAGSQRVWLSRSE